MDEDTLARDDEYLDVHFIVKYDLLIIIYIFSIHQIVCLGCVVV